MQNWGQRITLLAFEVSSQSEDIAILKTQKKFPNIILKFERLHALHISSGAGQALWEQRNRNHMFLLTDDWVPLGGGRIEPRGTYFFWSTNHIAGAGALFIMGLVILQHWFTIAENLFRASNHYHSKDHTHQYPMNMVSRSRKLPLKFIYEYLGRWRKYSELSEFILFTHKDREEQHFKRKETKQLGRRAKSWNIPSIFQVILWPWRFWGGGYNLKIVKLVKYYCWLKLLKIYCL